MTGTTTVVPNPSGAELAVTLTDSQTNALTVTAGQNAVALTSSGETTDEITSIVSSETGLLRIRNDDANSIIVNDGNNIVLLGSSLTLRTNDVLELEYRSDTSKWHQTKVIPGAKYTIATLTDSSGGTAADTIAAIGGTYSQTEVRNAVATLARSIARIEVALGLTE